ncbi:hypothetical protein [Microbacterium faecale]|nr:hypothetical protein [Microbacterium faecale]
MTARRSLGRRILAGLAGLALLGGIALAPTAEQTDAAWTDAEAGAAEFTAGTALDPLVATGDGCVASGLLGIAPRVEITWHVPDGTAYTIDDVEFGQLNNGLLTPIIDLELLNSITTTGTPDAYTTVITSLALQNLLGGDKVIGMRISDSGWTSPWLVATANWGPLGLAPSCDISTSP